MYISKRENPRNNFAASLRGGVWLWVVAVTAFWGLDCAQFIVSWSLAGRMGLGWASVWLSGCVCEYCVWYKANMAAMAVEQKSKARETERERHRESERERRKLPRGAKC